ncbi:hypothetical protein ECEC4402_5983, partial [Escherichia coli EC4402]
MWYYCPGESCS